MESLLLLLFPNPIPPTDGLCRVIKSNYKKIFYLSQIMLIICNEYRKNTKIKTKKDSLILNFRYTNFGIAASSPHPKFKTQKLIQDNQRMLQVLWWRITKTFSIFSVILFEPEESRKHVFFYSVLKCITFEGRWSKRSLNKPEI